MIKFFRKIRQRLLMENKFSKYFIYAIGEIILVVIGILIALSINNWNEEKKVRNYELNQLEEIRENLLESKIEIDNDIKFNTNTVKLYERILTHIKSGLPYEKSLDSAFFVFTNWGSPFLPKNGYETLKTSGINIIQNEKLKKEIIKIYEQTFEYLINDADKGEWSLGDAVTTPFSAKHIKYFDDGTSKYARPNDYEALKKNPEFENILRILIRKRKANVRYFVETSKGISDLIAMIDVELENRINNK
jgi:hypothetical protein